MWPLCDTFMMMCIYYEQLDPYYQTGNVFGYTIINWRWNPDLAFFRFSSFHFTCCTQMPDFWNKWSWGLCVIPLWCNTYIMNKWTHITQLMTYLGTPLNKKHEFGAFSFSSIKFHDKCYIQMPDLEKIITRPLCYTFIMQYIYNEQRDPYYSTGNIFVTIRGWRYCYIQGGKTGSFLGKNNPPIAKNTLKTPEMIVNRRKVLATFHSGSKTPPSRHFPPCLNQ